MLVVLTQFKVVSTFFSLVVNEKLCVNCGKSLPSPLIRHIILSIEKRHNSFWISWMIQHKLFQALLKKINLIVCDTFHCLLTELKDYLTSLFLKAYNLSTWRHKILLWWGAGILMVTRNSVLKRFFRPLDRKSTSLAVHTLTITHRPYSCY